MAMLRIARIQESNADVVDSKRWRRTGQAPRKRRFVLTERRAESAAQPNRLASVVSTASLAVSCGGWAELEKPAILIEDAGSGTSLIPRALRS
jgi:hypothetical protein